MKLLLFLLVGFGLSCGGSDALYAIVKGTNVLAVWQFDPTKPPKALTNAPFAGATNIVITDAEQSVIKPGWTYANGEFRDSIGTAISNVTKARIDRAKLIDAAITKLNTMQSAGTTAVANWASLTAVQKDAAQKQTIDSMVTVSRMLELLLLEQRPMFDVKETQ